MMQLTDSLLPDSEQIHTLNTNNTRTNGTMTIMSASLSAAPPVVVPLLGSDSSSSTSSPSSTPAAAFLASLQPVATTAPAPATTTTTTAGVVPSLANKGNSKPVVEIRWTPELEYALVEHVLSTSAHRPKVRGSRQQLSQTAKWTQVVEALYRDPLLLPQLTFQGQRLLTWINARKKFCRLKDKVLSKYPNPSSMSAEEKKGSAVVEGVVASDAGGKGREKPHSLEVLLLQAVKEEQEQQIHTDSPRLEAALPVDDNQMIEEEEGIGGGGGRGKEVLRSRELEADLRMHKRRRMESLRMVEGNRDEIDLLPSSSSSSPSMLPPIHVHPALPVCSSGDESVDGGAVVGSALFGDGQGQGTIHQGAAPMAPPPPPPVPPLPLPLPLFLRARATALPSMTTTASSSSSSSSSSWLPAEPPPRPSVGSSSRGLFMLPEPFKQFLSFDPEVTAMQKRIQEMELKKLELEVHLYDLLCQWVAKQLSPPPHPPTT
eukprot:scaffold5319_cov218-Ochromonas_danica.AAC.7